MSGLPIEDQEFLEMISDRNEESSAPNFDLLEKISPVRELDEADLDSDFSNVDEDVSPIENSRRNSAKSNSNSVDPDPSPIFPENDQNISADEEAELYDDFEPEEVPRSRTPSDFGSKDPRFRAIAESFSINNMSMNRQSFMKIKTKKLLLDSPPKKEIKKKIAELQKKQMNSTINQEKIINESRMQSSGARNESGLNPSRKFLGRKNPDINKRIDELADLGGLGFELEDLRTGIIEKYEEMILTIKTNLEELKKNFNRMIQNKEKEYYNTIENEKKQNLDNLTSLQEKLVHAMRTEKNMKKNPEFTKIAPGNNRPEFDTSLIAFKDFFSFVKEFREEFFGLVLSKPIPLNMKSLIKALEDFSSRQLTRLTSAPKAFPSELFRFFENNANYDYFINEADPTFGGSIFAASKLPEKVEIEKNKTSLPCLMENEHRTPVIEILDHRHLVVMVRNDFNIFGYNWELKTKKQKKAAPSQKSRFFKQAAQVQNLDPMQFNKIISLSECEFSPEIDPNFHCLKYVISPEGEEMLIIGGNFNVRNFFYFLEDFYFWT